MKIQQVPWENFSEEEIHLLLSEFLEDEGHKVYNLHKIQRSEERGSDLIVEKNSSKIAIAVKLRPENKDRAQLLDLSRRGEQEKWYIYIKDPTPRFREDMTFENIKFLPKKELNEYLFNLNPYRYISLLLDNQALSYLLMKIRRRLIEFNIEAEGNKGSPACVDKDSLNILWRLKDDTVAFNKIFGFIQTMFEHIEDKEPKIEDDIITLEGFLRGMQSMIEYCQNIFEFLNEFYDKNKNFTHHVIQETKIRSHWLVIFGRFKLYIPAHVEKIIEESKKEEEKLNAMLNDLPAEISPYDKNNILHAITVYSREVFAFMYSVEAFIDDLFSYGTFGKHSAHVLKEEPEDFIPFMNDEN